jgi:2-oxoglutarate dehydrogenase E2 component (dihydrolipoamide succinyltransferase)
MSFFVKACVAALQEFPKLNASLEGGDVLYKHFCHIGVAVGSEKGLVVPVIRHAEHKSFADIEKDIKGFGDKIKNNTLMPQDLQGGTFSISNGGIFGSLLSTPILNAPQSALLGMHAIQKRAVVVNDQIVIRPMMYLALSYDHRLIDGREAVLFLVKIKQMLENPAYAGLDL